ncbi:glycosyltransferase family 57 protein, partial [Phlebopus sp. FC_14]
MSTSVPSSPSYSLPPPIPEDEVPEKRKSLESHPQWPWFNVLEHLTRSDIDLLLSSVASKLLLFPSYRSTDFEVHRNWLAITYSLPISRWYYDTTSQWTLDYPPFFAYFEKLLSIPAAFVDPAIVDIQNINYDAWSVVAYQRTTVIISELVLGAALLRLIRVAGTPEHRIPLASLFFHPGFLIVDHIHFQYNGFLFGILLWSILMAHQGRKLASGILFAVLLNFKHIFVYLAPAYFVYLLRSYCMSPSGEILPTRFISLANAIILVFAVSFGPFILMGQLPQLLSRLFPFTRGLNHAYWAPNTWALATAADRAFLQLVKQFNIDLTVNEHGVASTSRGLVGDTTFAVIPDIKPIHTFLITIAFQLLYLVKLWRAPTYKSFLTALTLCGYTSFMFGWHVHEKAILLILVPLSLLAADDYASFKTFLIASTAGIFSLFPLLFTPAETLIKILYSLVWGAMVIRPLYKQIYEFPSSFTQVLLEHLENIYLNGFVLLQAFVLLFPVLTRDKPDVEFLPLLMTSVYCATGLMWAFMRLSVIYLRK